MKHTTVDFTKERTRPAAHGMRAIDVCPVCGRQAAVQTYHGRVIWYDHRVTYGNHGGIGVELSTDRCSASTLKAR